MNRLKVILEKGIVNTIGNFSKDISKIRCFTYHNVSDSVVEKYTLLKKDFENHIKFIYKNHYETIDSDILVTKDYEILSKKQIICLTFDDGFKSNLFVADLLSEYKLKAIFFITTSFVNKNGYLDWKEIKELFYRGFEIGSHSHTHRNLRMLSKEEIYNELYISKDILQNRLGKEIKSFAFPFGKKNSINELAFEMLEKTNYSIAYTQFGGHIPRNINLFKIPRIGINSTDNVYYFKKKIEGYYDLFKNLTYFP